MGAILDALQRLQTIETQLRAVRGQINAKKRAVQAQQKRMQKIEQQMTEARELVRKTQTEADRMELERKSHESHLAKLREALNQAKTNKEYAAILTQLNTDKADVLKMEDAVLAVMGKIDEARQQETQLQSNLVAENTKLADLQKAVLAIEAQQSTKIQDLEAKRDEATSQLPPQALNIFERCCERNDGEAMAAVERTHPKRGDYICTGCNMSVPLDTINALQTRDEVLICQVCSRILFFER